MDQISHLRGIPGLQELPLIAIIALGIVGSIIVTLFPFWIIFKKAGFHPALSILTVLPVVNIIVLYYVALSSWPALKKINQ